MRSYQLYIYIITYCFINLIVFSISENDVHPLKQSLSNSVLQETEVEEEISNFSEVDSTCPDPEEIKPCFCKPFPPYGPILDCSLEGSEDHLAKVFRDADFPIRDMNIMKFVRNHNITYLRGDLFQDLTFDRFYIMDTTISKVGPDTFLKSIERLDWIDISRSLITNEDFPFHTLPKYKVLTHLILVDNKFSRVPHINSDSLQKLDFSRNNFKHIKASDFDSLPNLRTLMLESNNIEEVQPGMFFF